MSERATHTPGPWKMKIWGQFARDATNHRHPVCDITANHDNDGYGDAIARVTTVFISESEPVKDWQANARLIATAPELLEALQIVRDLATRDDLDADTETLRQVALIARAAIAKATGETP